jgi:NTP pyrophosphatase (non-canonical NTP hydrolase)
LADRKPPAMFAIGSPKWPGLSKLDEEAGEVVQVIGKLMGTGGDPDHWDGTDLRIRLQEEIADVLAACDFVQLVNPYALDEVAIAERRREKLETFLRWHREQGGGHD